MADYIDFASRLNKLKQAPKEATKQEPKDSGANKGYIDFASRLPGARALPSVEDVPAADQPYYKAPDFAGQSYFDDETAAIKSDEDALMKEGGPPDFSQRIQGIRKREQQVRADQKQWNQGFPEELSALPEVSVGHATSGYTPTGKRTAGKQYGGLLAMSYLAPEDKDKVAILENAGWNVEMINGFPKISNPETGQEYALNKPGFSGNDVSDFLATALQYAGVGPAVRAVTGIGKKVVVGAAASALTESAKQGLEKALGGEFDGSEVGISALFGGAAEVAIPALRGIWGRLSPAGREKLLAAKSVDEIRKLGVGSAEELQKLQQLADRAKQAQQTVKDATGVEVPVFRGQATQLPSQMLEQRYLAQLDPTSRKALDALRGQNEKAFDATIKILDTIAPMDSIENATMGIRQAAKAEMVSTVDRPLMKALTETLDGLGTTQGAANSAKSTRQAAKMIRESIDTEKFDLTSKLYSEAYAESPQVNVGPIRASIENALSRFKKGHDAIPDLEKAKTLLTDDFASAPRKKRVPGFGEVELKGKKPIPPTLQQIHDAREMLDKWINWDGDNRLTQSAINELKSIRDSLNSQIGAVSPKFRKADSIFSRYQRNLEELDESLVGAIARKEDATVETIAQEVFGGKWGAEDIARFKVSIPKGSYGDLYRSFIDSKIGKLSRASATPQQYLDALFPDDGTMRRLLDLAPDNEARKNLQRLRVTLEQAKRKYGTTRIGRIAQIPDEKIGGVLKEIFSAKVDPGEIEQVRDIIIANGGQDAWDKILRAELTQRVTPIESLATDKGAESIPNIANKLLSSIYGNPMSRLKLMNASSGEARKNLLALEDLLYFVQSGRAAGSPTSPFQRIAERLMGRFRVVKQGITSPIDTAAGIGDETIFNRNARALADVVYDEKWLERMSRIRAMGQTPQAVDAFSRLLDDAIRTGTQATQQAAIPGADLPNTNL